MLEEISAQSRPSQAKHPISLKEDLSKAIPGVDRESEA